MKLFKAVVLVEVTTDDEGNFVDASRINVEVFARDEAHVRVVVAKLDPRLTTTTRVESVEYKCDVDVVENFGVLVGVGESIYRGYYTNSPLYGKSTPKAQG